MRHFVSLIFALVLLLPQAASAQSSQIDAIILVDTSASMIDDLDQVCDALPNTERLIRESFTLARVRVVGIIDKYKCAQDTARSLVPNSAVLDDEDWGIAAAELAADYAWQPGAIRLIMPLSDAGPASGNPIQDPGPDRDATSRAIRAALANKVILSPILAAPEADVTQEDRARLETLAQEMAARTGGRLFISRSPADLSTALQQSAVASAEAQAGLTVVASGIPTPDRISLDPGILLTNAILAVLIVALFGFTTALYSETFRSRPASPPTRRVTKAIASASNRVRKTIALIATPTAWPIGNTSIRRLVTVVILTAFLALTALVASFLDPNFQPNTRGGVVTFVTLLVALTIVNLTAAFGGGRAARARQAAPGLRVRPGAVLLAAACVVISRNIGFTPGYLLGLPAGLALLAAEANPGRDAAIGRASIFAAIIIGALAWLLSWPMGLASAALAGGSSSGPAEIAQIVAGGVQSALLTIFLVAFQFALFDLMPFGEAAGRKWFAGHKLTWGTVFGVVAFVALHALINPYRAGLDALRNPGLLPLGAIACVYSGVTLVAWLLTNESRLRDPQNLNRRSALTAGAVMITWLAGIVCIALAEVASTFSTTTLLIGAGVIGIAGVGVWAWSKRRAKPAAPAAPAPPAPPEIKPPAE